MIVVTSGSAFLDIDAFAGSIAYADLLLQKGVEAVAVSTAPLNASITPDIRSKLSLDTYAPKENDQFVLIDVSNPGFFDTFVNQDTVVEVIDHHPGHEVYWQEKLGNKAHIEPIGAACTLVYERYLAENMADKIQPATAEALAAGILDNTFNFTAQITNQRDKDAYIHLLSLAGKDEAYASAYFSACQNTIEENLEDAIRNDLKHVTETTFLPEYFGQLVIWDAKVLLERELEKIVACMNAISADWCVNLVSIVDGKSYILAASKDAQEKMSRLYNVVFVGAVAAPMPARLRKEILKKAIDLEARS